MTQKTLEELEQQIADAKLAIAKLEIDPLRAINEEIAKIDFAAVVKVIMANLDGLTDQRRQQAKNIVDVFSHSPAFLVAEATRLDALINPPPAPEPQARPDIEAP